GKLAIELDNFVIAENIVSLVSSVLLITPQKDVFFHGLKS
ncbi:hypothetical protein W657_02843, partial [Staphylococcus aureus VET0436R]